MTTNLLSVIEQQHKALKMLQGKLTGNVNGADETCFIISMKNQVSYAQMVRVSEAIAAAQQALEQARGEAEYFGLEPWERPANVPVATMIFPKHSPTKPFVALGDCAKLYPDAAQCKPLYTHPQASEPLSHAKTESTVGTEDAAITSVNGSEPAPSLVCPPAKSNGEPSVTKGKWFSDEAHPSNAGIAVVADAIKEALQDADLPAPTGCGHCQNPLYAGTKCKNCGRVSEPAPSTAGEAAPKATMFHDAGAIAQCGYCQRYTLDRKALSDRQPVCTCGEKYGWSGSFKPPGADAHWHGPAPAAQPSQGERAHAAINLHDAWLYFTGAEPSLSRLGQAIDHASALLQSTAMPVGELTDERIYEMWVDLLRKTVAQKSLPVVDFARAILAAARSHPTTEESLAVAGAQLVREPLTDDFLQTNDYYLLHRFIETTEDDEGYDITKAEIKRLADLGVVQSHGFGKYSVTMFGYWVHERYWEQNPSLPLKTNTDRDAEAASGITKKGEQ